MVVVMAATCCLPGLARTQPNTASANEVLVIPVHPSTPTIVQLPDEILDAWILHRGEFLFETVGHDVNLRPRPDTPVGTEAMVEVETSAMRHVFRVRVVEHHEDAVQKLVLHGGKTVERTGGARPDIPPGMPAEPEPAASAPPSTPPPSSSSASPSRLPDAGPAPAPQRTEATAERVALAAGSPRFALSGHATLALAGFTALDVPGYVPDKGRRAHRAFGLRVVAEPRDTWWSVEAGISAERLDAPTVHVRDLGNMRQEELQTSGSWLRADAGLRVGAGTRWKPTVYLGLGLQVHLRTTETTMIVMRVRGPPDVKEDMPRGAVLTLGLGLQRHLGDVLLGVDFQMRQGVPADYFSLAALLSAAVFLDQGD